jgi:hypothetical protein
MAYARAWKETVTTGEGETATSVVTTHRIDVDDANEQIELNREASGNGQMANSIAAALVNIYHAPRGARSILPGEAGRLLTLPDESVLSVGAEGQVYLDGRRLGTAMVAKLTQVGKSIYGRGKTDGKWWRWTGSAWTEAADVDAGLLIA